MGKPDSAERRVLLLCRRGTDARCFPSRGKQQPRCCAEFVEKEKRESPEMLRV